MAPGTLPTHDAGVSPVTTGDHFLAAAVAELRQNTAELAKIGEELRAIRQDLHRAVTQYTKVSQPSTTVTNVRVKER